MPPVSFSAAHTRRGFTAPSEKQHERAGSCSSSESGGNPRNRGFTLVETLVAIAVIATAITGPLYAIQQSLNASRSARDQLIASALAQEGVEFVRGTRDNNYISMLEGGATRTWLASFDGTAGGTVSSANCITASCVVDPKERTISRTITPLYLSAAKVYNQQGNGTVTPYTRTVRLSAVPGSVTEMTVTVTVSWMTRNVPYTIIIVERLHNWL